MDAGNELLIGMGLNMTVIKSKCEFLFRLGEFEHGIKPKRS